MVSSKNGPSSGSGLSKIASAWSRPSRHHAFDRVLAARDEAFDDDLAPPSGSRSARTSGRASSARTRPIAARTLRGVVGANHAAAAGQARRLDDAGIRERGSRARRPPARSAGTTREPRRRQAGGAKRLARAQLADAARDGLRRVARAAAAPPRPARQHGRPIPHRHHAGERSLGRGRRGCASSEAASSMEAHRHRRILPGIVERVAAVRREDQIDAEPRRGVVERPQLVAGRGRETGGCARCGGAPNQISATCADVGSAQQYQGSFRYGMAARGRPAARRGGAASGRRPRARRPRPARTSRSAAPRRAAPTSARDLLCSRSTRGSAWRHG